MVDTLAHIELLSGLSESELEALAKRCSWRRFGADQQVLAHLDAGTDVLFLVEGRLRVSLYSPSGKEVLFEDIQAGEDVCRQEHPIERQLESTVAGQDGHPRRFFSFTPRVVRQLYTNSGQGRRGDNHHDQNSNTAGGRVRNTSAQISNSSSSSYINKTTTTQGPLNFVLTGEDGQPLVYPARLSDNHRGIATRYLSELAPDQRQPILDELEGRFRAEEKGMKPVYDEISFLHSLCKGMRKGKFLPNLGVRVRDGRRGGKKHDPESLPKQSVQQPRETDEQRQKRRAVSKVQIVVMRKILGMRLPTGNQCVTGES